MGLGSGLTDRFTVQCVRFGMKTAPNVKGMTDMHKNKQIQLQLCDIVSAYASYDSLSECYVLDVRRIPDHDIDPLCALLLSDPDIAAEATGPDNPAWEKTMLPALARRFYDSKKDYVKEEVESEWTNGVRGYLLRYIEPVLIDVLRDYNCDHGCVSEVVYDRDRGLTYEKRYGNGA